MGHAVLFNFGLTRLTRGWRYPQRFDFLVLDLYDFAPLQVIFCFINVSCRSDELPLRPIPLFGGYCSLGLTGRLGIRVPVGYRTGPGRVKLDAPLPGALTLTLAT